MKKIGLLICTTLILINCKTEQKKTSTVNNNYPNELIKVFDKHGGLHRWLENNTLVFKKGDEKHTVDLKSRKTIINSSTYILGFDGKDAWLKTIDSSAFKGNPKFYYNLYFYFYAMPFVLADEGITYEKTSPLVHNGIEYPGYKISYNENVGVSSNDNYLIYYHPTTFQMEWLAYTVTYFSQKESTKYNFIRYGEWELSNELLLPKAITWYQKNEQGLPTEPAKEPVEFTLETISATKLDSTIFQKQ